jgi:hypothetical protein
VAGFERAPTPTPGYASAATCRRATASILAIGMGTKSNRTEAGAASTSAIGAAASSTDRRGTSSAAAKRSSPNNGAIAAIARHPALAGCFVLLLGGPQPPNPRRSASPPGEKWRCQSSFQTPTPFHVPVKSTTPDPFLHFATPRISFLQHGYRQVLLLREVRCRRNRRCLDALDAGPARAEFDSADSSPT